MVFLCQKDSFLKELTTSVISCKDAKIHTIENGKKNLIDGFEVILKDTILFPEEAASTTSTRTTLVWAEPWDLGTIDGKQVIQVTRRGADAVHYLRYALEEGKCVDLKLDWDRRFDHMQQHSGQHLISATLDAEYGFKTSSWWLGEEISYIELDSLSLGADQMNHVGALVNQYIREGRPVQVKEYEANDPELEKAQTRGLPEDLSGLVRVVAIEGLDKNMCCGTHVSNLSQLQMIALTSVEKGKKGKVKLNFLVGNRALKKLDELLVRETSLSNLLQNNGTMHVELVEKIQDTLKTATKNLQHTLRELATIEAQKLLSTTPKPDYFFLHRKEGDMDFINTFLREFHDESVLLLLFVGEEPNVQVLVHGAPERVQKVGNKLIDKLGGKGFGKGSRYQAKIINPKVKEVTIEIIKNIICENN